MYRRFLAAIIFVELTNYAAVKPVWAQSMPPTLDCTITFQTLIGQKFSSDFKPVDQPRTNFFRIEFPSTDIAILYNKSISSPLRKNLMITNSAFQLSGVLDVSPDLAARIDYSLKIDRTTAALDGHSRYDLGDGREEYTSITGSCERATIIQKF